MRNARPYGRAPIIRERRRGLCDQTASARRPPFVANHDVSEGMRGGAADAAHPDELQIPPGVGRVGGAE